MTEGFGDKEVTPVHTMTEKEEEFVKQFYSYKDFGSDIFQVLAVEVTIFRGSLIP